MKLPKRIFLIVMVAQVVVSAASAQSNWSMRGGMGFMADPDAFLMSIEVDRRLNNYFSLGTLFHIGVEDQLTVVAPQGYLRAGIRIAGTDASGNAEVTGLEPFVMGGIGFTYIKKTDRAPGKSESETGFLTSVGGGIDYHVTPRLTVGSRMHFNFLPSDALGHDFYYTWELVTMRIRF